MNTQEHLLACLAEECGEVIQAVGKSLRFGLEDKPPTGGLRNVAYIEREFNDVLAVAELLKERGVQINIDRDAIEEKKAKVKYFMEYADSLGTITTD